MKDESYQSLLKQKGLKKTKVRMALLQHFNMPNRIRTYRRHWLKK